MGNLLGFFGKQGPEIDVNLEGEIEMNLSEEEMRVYKEVQELLDASESVFNRVEEYKGCQELARTAIMTSSAENEAKAFEGLLVAVDSIAIFFEYCNKLQAIFPKFVSVIAKDYTAGDDLQEQVPQALCKQLIHLVGFAIRFDQVRMLRPNLSNDFSYYRRLLPKFNKNPDIRIKDDAASGMALFTAQHIPMVNALIKASEKAVAKDERVSLVLALLGNSCLKAIRDGRLTNKDTRLVCARGMAGAVVLYDHVAIPHAFQKKAPIKTKEIVVMLKREFSSEVPLLNAIKFSTKNYNDAPDSLQRLFE